MPDTQNSWDNAILPPSTDYCFLDLTTTQRSAAITLGYTESTWNYPFSC